jgi:type II secretory pathway pseudopilin PulG
MHRTVRKKNYITLIEMMIVMFLIALITGVIAYNYRGSLDEGKAFKTKAGTEKLETILNLKVSENPSLLDDIESSWRDIVRNSPLVQNPDALIKDGWGRDYQVTVENGVIRARSEAYENYARTHQTMFSQDQGQQR